MQDYIKNGMCEQAVHIKLVNLINSYFALNKNVLSY